MIDKAKTYTTTHGRPAQVYTTTAGGPYPVHAAWRDEGGRWNHQCYTSTGRLNIGADGVLDLVEVKERRVMDVWVNIYPSRPSSQTHPSKTSADCVASSERTECLHIVHEYEEGEGLS